MLLDISLKLSFAFATKNSLDPPIAIYLAVAFPISFPPCFTAYLVAEIAASLAEFTDSSSAVFIIAEVAP